MLKQCSWWLLREFVYPNGSTLFCSRELRAGIKVTICGANGRVGQSLALMLKCSPFVSQLALYDVAHTPGLALDLSHINNSVRVKGFVGRESLPQALRAAQVVLMTAGEARKPGMKRRHLLEKNGGIVAEISAAVALSCPKAMYAIVTDPVNMLVPIAAGVLKKSKAYDPKRLFGVTTLDTVRASTFLAEYLEIDPAKVNVPVVGGHSGKTIVPLLSQAVPETKLSQDEINELTVKIQFAGAEVVKVKAGMGSSSLSMAFAGTRFTMALCRALRGETPKPEPAYVRSDVTGARYFSSQLLLGPKGVEKNLGLGNITVFEEELVRLALVELQENIKVGENFVKNLK